MRQRSGTAIAAMPFGISCKSPLLVGPLPTGYVVSVSIGAGKKNKCGGFASSGRPGPRMTLLLMRTARGKVLMGQGHSCPWSKPNAAQPPHLQTVYSRTALALAV